MQTVCQNESSRRDSRLGDQSEPDRPLLRRALATRRRKNTRRRFVDALKPSGSIRLDPQERRRLRLVLLHPDDERLRSLGHDKELDRLFSFPL
jgi:hypothetical protein